MNKNNITIDIRHLPLFDALRMVILKSCEHFIENTETKICWIVENPQLVRLCAPLKMSNCVFVNSKMEKISA